MSLRCLGHETIMFGMFSTCSKPRKTIDTLLLAAWSDFQYKFVKKWLVWTWKWLPNTRNSKYHVSFCVCVCVVRTLDNARFIVLILRNVLNTHIIGVECLENFLRARKGREVIFSAQSGKIQKKIGKKKVDFGGQNDLKLFFFF